MVCPVSSSAVPSVQRTGRPAPSRDVWALPSAEGREVDGTRRGQSPALPWHPGLMPADCQGRGSRPPQAEKSREGASHLVDPFRHSGLVGGFHRVTGTEGLL